MISPSAWIQPGISASLVRTHLILGRQICEKHTLFADPQETMATSVGLDSRCCFVHSVVEEMIGVVWVYFEQWTMIFDCCLNSIHTVQNVAFSHSPKCYIFARPEIFPMAIVYKLFVIPIWQKLRINFQMAHDLILFRLLKIVAGAGWPVQPAPSPKNVRNIDCCGFCSFAALRRVLRLFVMYLSR